MPQANQGWRPPTSEQIQNMSRYGDANPWERVDEQPIYEVLMKTPLGREVRLTKLETYQHTHTDETREWICPGGSVEFVFHDQWPENNVLERDLLQYRPSSETSV